MSVNAILYEYQASNKVIGSNQDSFPDISEFSFYFPGGGSADETVSFIRIELNLYNEFDIA